MTSFQTVSKTILMTHRAVCISHVGSKLGVYRGLSQSTTSRFFEPYFRKPLHRSQKLWIQCKYYQNQQPVRWRATQAGADLNFNKKYICEEKHIQVLSQGMEFEVGYLEVTRSIELQGDRWGPVALGVHGSPGMPEDFEVFFQPLVKRVDRIILPDFPGILKSTVIFLLKVLKVLVSMSRSDRALFPIRLISRIGY